jgi:type I restriction enzyme S subunit
MTGTNPNIQKINQKVILHYPYPTSAPQPEQRRIVAHLNALQAKADALRALQAETAVELDALLPAVLAKAFAGEL